MFNNTTEKMKSITTNHYFLHIHEKFCTLQLQLLVNQTSLLDNQHYIRLPAYFRPFLLILNLSIFFKWNIPPSISKNGQYHFRDIKNDENLKLKSLVRLHG